MKCQYVKHLKYSGQNPDFDYGSYYWCDLSDNPCDHYTTGSYCQEYEDELKEEEDDNRYKVG